MNTISLCMIVKNEEEVIERCLDTVFDLVDEIIIVDTGSTDKTKEIAFKYTDKVYDFKWIDDFAQARNYSFSKATMDFIMWLDADDVLLKDDRYRLKDMKEKLNTNEVDVVISPYNILFDEFGNPTLSYNRERIFLRSKNLKWKYPIHEVIVPTGNIIFSDFTVTHKKIKSSDSKRNINIFKSLISSGVELDDRMKYYYARELMFNKEVREAIKYFNDFLNQGNGWIENNINACSDLAKCYGIIGERNKKIKVLFRSFEFDTPRAEICCDIGLHFLGVRKISQAIYWYKLALTIEYNNINGGFKQKDCYDFIPYIQLCVCYDRLGDKKLANEYNEKAATIKPYNNIVIRNRQYFNNVEIDK